MSIILKALAMIRPNDDFVRGPSETRPSIELSEEAFASFADTATSSLVSLDPDGVSDPQEITSYSLPRIVQSDVSGKPDVWPGHYIVDKKT